MDWLRILTSGGAATLVVLLLVAWQRTVSPTAQGWRRVTIGPLYMVGLWLGGALWILFAYVRFFVGSSRADAATQMQWLNLLLVGFAILWICTAVGALRIRATALRWRGQQLRFRSAGQWHDCRIDDVLSVHPSAIGRTRIEFRDGTLLYVDPNAQGAAQLLQRIENAAATYGERDETGENA